MPSGKLFGESILCTEELDKRNQNAVSILFKFFNVADLYSKRSTVLTSAQK